MTLEEWLGAAVQGGLGLLGLYLFVRNIIQSKPAVDERIAELKTAHAEAIAQRDARFAEMRADRNEWRRLALGTERRLDVAAPIIATAARVAVPSPTPDEGRG